MTKRSKKAGIVGKYVPTNEQQKTVLKSGKYIREEIDKTKKDEWSRFKQMDPCISGRGAEPVYRDKRKGERISKDEHLKSEKKVLPNLGDNEKMKESGFVIPQEIPDHSWLKRGLDAAPNRYVIRPGRHWDGVDSSTGFEKESFTRTNEKEARFWSVSDM
ncbi:BUD13-like protein [Quillaja saponaria]|uniref:BUD13-like protein n=1 Tax=Quillaja saponaria TaxID=32244 RepID=A0AAD7L7G0_QUISA|nr:BUD13-like protein [Quillaja saponaria]